MRMAVVRFGAFEFDRETRQLSRDSRYLAIEPKVADLLALLIDRRDRVVSRAEILETLWPRQEIGEASVSRLIYELRKALSDSAGAPRYVRTVPRRGVQFIAALESGAASAVESHASVPPVRRIGRAWLALLLVVTMLLVAFALRPLPAPDAAAVSVAPARIGLIHAIRPGAGAQAEMLAVTLVDLLWHRLADAEGVEVRSPLATAALAVEVDSLAEFGDRLAVDALVSVTIGPSSAADQATVSAELVQLGGEGRLLRTPLREHEVPLLESDRDLVAFLELRERFAASIVEEVGGLVLGPVGEGAPASVEAWRLYLLARDRLAELSCDAEGARALLDRVVELDPDFVLGHVLLGLAHYNAAWACGQGRARLVRAQEAIVRALELQPDHAPAIYLQTMIGADIGSAVTSVAAAEAFLEEHPNSAMVHAALAYALPYTGRLDDAREALDRALDLDPLVLAVETGNTPTVLLYRAEWQRYLDVAPAGTGPIETFYRAQALRGLGREDAADQQLRDCAAAAPGDRFASLCSVRVLHRSGRTADALVRLRAMDLSRHDEQAVDGEIDFKFAQLYAELGEAAPALEAAQRAWSRGFRCGDCFLNDPDIGRMAGHPEASDRAPGPFPAAP